MSVSLTLLGENETAYEAVLTDFDDERMRLSDGPVLPLGSPVRIYRDPRLWLGEVIECGSGGMLVIRLVHSLADVHELTGLADRFLGKRRMGAPTLF